VTIRFAPWMLLGTILLVPPAAAGFREQTPWRFRSASETQVRLNLEVRRLELRGGARDGGGTAVTLGGAALAAGVGGGRSQSGSSALNAVSAAPTYNVTVEGSDNRITVDGYLNLSTDQQADRARSRILNR